MFGGGGGGGAPRRFDSTYFPRSTGEVRFGIRRQHQDAAVTEQAATRTLIAVA